MSEEKIVEAYYVNARLEAQKIPLGGSGGGTDITIEDAASDHKAADGYAVSPYALKQVETKAEAAQEAAESAASNSATATKLATKRTISLTGDASGSAAFDGSANATITATLAASGVTAGAYGPSANATLKHGGTFTVPQITVDAKGRATVAATRTMTLPSDRNTDTKVTQTVTTTNDDFPVLTTALADAAANRTEGVRFDTKVKINHSTGQITAPKFNGPSTSCTGNAATATKLATKRTISLTGDASGSAAFDGSANATITATLAASGVTAGAYGPSANATLKHGGTFTVPQITVDAKGRATVAATRTMTLPSDRNTDTKVTQTVTTTNDDFPVLTTALADAAANRTEGVRFDTKVKINHSTGQITAPKFNGPSTSCTGNAATATKLATKRTIRTNLASTAAASFDGSANITPGVTGTLPIANGGTGRNDGLAVSVTKKFTLSQKGALGYGENNDYLADKAALAWWNGAYAGSMSNLTYCANGTIVGTSGNQTIAGNKTFGGTVALNGTTTVSKTPTANTHVANKKYVDDTVTGKAMGAPDYSAGISLSTANTTYTVPQNGYLVILMNDRDGQVHFSINNTVNFHIEGAYYASSSSDGPNVYVNTGNDTVIPVAKNDVIKNIPYLISNVSLKFFPSK